MLRTKSSSAADPGRSSGADWPPLDWAFWFGGSFGPVPPMQCGLPYTGSSLECTPSYGEVAGQKYLPCWAAAMTPSMLFSPPQFGPVLSAYWGWSPGAYPL